MAWSGRRNKEQESFSIQISSQSQIHPQIETITVKLLLPSWLVIYSKKRTYCIEEETHEYSGGCVGARDRSDWDSRWPDGEVID